MPVDGLFGEFTGGGGSSDTKTESFSSALVRRDTGELAATVIDTKKPSVNNMVVFFKGIARSIDVYHTLLSDHIMTEISARARNHPIFDGAKSWDDIATMPSEKRSEAAIKVVQDTVDAMKGEDWWEKARGDAETAAIDDANRYLGTLYNVLMADTAFQTLRSHFVNIFSLLFDYNRIVALAVGETPVDDNGNFPSVFDRDPEHGLSMLATSMHFFAVVHAHMTGANAKMVVDALRGRLPIDVGGLMRLFFGVTADALSRKSARVSSGTIPDSVRESLVQFIAHFKDLPRREALRFAFLLIIYTMLDNGLAHADESEKKAGVLSAMINRANGLMSYVSAHMEDFAVRLDTALASLDIPRFFDDKSARASASENDAATRRQSWMGRALTDASTAQLTSMVAAAKTQSASERILTSAYVKLIPIYVRNVLPVAASQYLNAIIEMCIEGSASLYDEYDDSGIDKFVDALLSQFSAPNSARVGPSAAAKITDDMIYAFGRLALGNSGALLGKLQQLFSDHAAVKFPVQYQRLYGTGKLKYPKMTALELRTVAQRLGISEGRSVLSNYNYKTTVSATVGNIIFLERRPFVDASQEVIASPLNIYHHLIVKFAKPRTLLLLAYERRFLDEAFEYLRTITTRLQLDAKTQKTVQDATSAVAAMLYKEYNDLLTEFNFALERENTEKMAHIYDLFWPVDPNIWTTLRDMLPYVAKEGTENRPYIHIGNVDVESPDEYTEFGRLDAPERFVAHMFTYAQSRAPGASLETIVELRQRVREANGSLLGLRPDEIVTYRMSSDDEALTSAMTTMLWEWIAKLFDSEKNPEGLFHSDLHAGNIFYYNGLSQVLPSTLTTGERGDSRNEPREFIDRDIYMTLIDYGKVGRIDGRKRGLVFPILSCVVTILTTRKSRLYADVVAYRRAGAVLTQLLLSFIDVGRPSPMVARVRETVSRLMDRALFDDGNTEAAFERNVLDTLAKLRFITGQYAERASAMASNNPSNKAYSAIAAATRRRLDAVESIETLIRALIALYGSFKKVLVLGMGRTESEAFAELMSIWKLPVTTLMRAIVDSQKTTSDVVSTSIVSYTWNAAVISGGYITRGMSTMDLIKTASGTQAAFNGAWKLTATTLTVFGGLASFLGPWLLGGLAVASVLAVPAIIVNFANNGPVLLSQSVPFLLKEESNDVFKRVTVNDIIASVNKQSSSLSLDGNNKVIANTYNGPGLPFIAIRLLRQKAPAILKSKPVSYRVARFVLTQLARAPSALIWLVGDPEDTQVPDAPVADSETIRSDVMISDEMIRAEEEIVGDLEKIKQ